MKLKIIREPSSPNSTIGTLYIDGVEECYTLEDVVRTGPKVPGKTAIPTGTYDVVIDWSSHFVRPMPHILNVPGFEGVRFHVGNFAENSAGCILLGTMKDKDAVWHSRDAFENFFARLKAAKDPITLEII